MWTPSGVFPGESEMAGRLRAFDWSLTTLGEPDHWPVNLKIALGVCLTSRFPMQVCWGPSLTVFYNDAYISFLGPSKHPAMIGRSGCEAWAEIWDTIGPMIHRVFSDGAATWSEDVLMYFDRDLPQEEVYVTFSLSPIFGSGGRVEGLFCACTETTEKIVGNRRLETLRKLGVDGAATRTVADACIAAVEVLRENPHDVPFAAIYLVTDDHGSTRVAATSGITPDEADGLRRTFADVLRSKSAADMPDRHAVVLPIRSATPEHFAGLLVAGVSERRPLDRGYRSFLDLVAGRIATALSDARAYEEAPQRAEALAAMRTAAVEANHARLTETAQRLEKIVLEERVRERAQELETFFKRLMTAQEEERRRIGRDIHDQLGQSMTALRLQIDAMRTNFLTEASMVSQIERVQRLAEELDASIDFLTWDLRPAVLDDLGLAAALQNLVQTWSTRFGIAAEFAASGGIDSRLNRDAQGNLYRITQEALHNVVKHAAATHVSVFLDLRGGRAILVIEDNGCGFDPAGRVHGAEEGQLGLISMRERASAIGGDFEIESAVGGGTTILVRVPVQAERLEV